MKFVKLFAVAAAAGLVGAVSNASSAGVIAQWNFNSTTPDASASTGTTSPSTGSGTLALVGSTTSTFAGGSPGDTSSATDNSGLNLAGFPSLSSNSGTAGIQVNVSTLGQPGPVQISFDLRQSPSASRYFQLMASSDGSTFTNVSGGTATFGAVSNNTNTSFSDTGLYSNTTSTGTQNFVQGITYTFPAGSVYENDPNFAFRIVSVFDPASGTSYTGSNGNYATSGTARFDLVTVAPEPTSACTLGVGGLLLLARRRRAR